MRIHLFCILLSLVALVTSATPARAADVIGTIMEVEGSATITTTGKTPVKAKVDDTIGINDVVSAGPKSKVFLLLIDDTEITLAENSRFKATEYVFDDQDTSQNKARYSFLSGAFEYFSGLMTKKANPDVNIATPYGSIGVRGTRLWAGNMDDGYGIHVDEGIVDVGNAGGKVRLAAGQGTDIASARTAPTRAAAWSRARRQQTAARVALKNPGTVAQRIAQHKASQQQLRSRYREALQQRRGGKRQQQQDNAAPDAQPLVQPERQRLNRLQNQGSGTDNGLQNLRALRRERRNK